MIRVLTCDTVIEAHIVKGRLDSDGIECILTNENFTTLLPHLNSIMGSGVQVMVSEDDFEHAKEILKDKIAPDNRALGCPYCGSRNIRLGLGRKKFPKIINILLAFLEGMPIGNMKPTYCCMDCSEEVW